MAKDTIHQKIWKRKEDDSLELSIPKIINSDIGFQLMFGMNEDYDYEKSLIKKHHDSNSPTIDKEDQLKDLFK